MKKKILVRNLRMQKGQKKKIKEKKIKIKMIKNDEKSFKEKTELAKIKDDENNTTN